MEGPKCLADDSGSSEIETKKSDLRVKEKAYTFGIEDYLFMNEIIDFNQHIMSEIIISAASINNRTFSL
ncbi:hypothetical protein RCL_jg26372.t1 [Rhizophagus clarus]|uniref:Uncharacterized protein n=1 Tax=Rhizophagus clarus TaxID=94130 RepID=A0A8H3KZ89_9GLOM|nr:hypothetical protein RCL_jg26372.t1 [Rhizophagus clarus]